MRKLQKSLSGLLTGGGWVALVTSFLNICPHSDFYIFYNLRLANVVPPLIVVQYLVCRGVSICESERRKVGQGPLRTRVQTHIVRYAAGKQIMAG